MHPASSSKTGDPRAFVPASRAHLQGSVEQGPTQYQAGDNIKGYNVKSGWCSQIIFSGYNNLLSFQD